MIRVGEVHMGTESKPLWGDIFKGDEDSDVPLWGIVKVNVSGGYQVKRMEKYAEAFENDSPVRFKRKEKDVKFGNYTSFYICRPVEKMNDILTVIRGFGQVGDVRIVLEKETFDDVRREEIAKAI